MDVEILSRIQFALTIAFHYIYPPLSIGLGVLLIIYESIYLKTRSLFHKNLVKFWVRVFALTFAIGVATGLVQVLEFGTNWATYSRYVGDVFGAALGAEGIFAFMLEAGFLAVLLFGWERVGPKTHFFSTVMVALGAHFSAVWIVIANSFMQTPAGFEIVGEGLNARAQLTAFWEMVFSPSSMDRLIHVLIGAWLAGAFLVISISAYYILKNRHLRFAHLSLKIALILASICIIGQTISGDSSARVTMAYQPTKLAALEGVFATQPYAPMSIFGWVDQEKQKVYGLKVPALLSILCYRSPSAVVKGLDAFPQDEWPMVNAVFQTYHLMLYMWGAMFASLVLGWIFWKKIKKGKQRWVLWILVISVLFPQIANQAGWFTAEMGRQPWIVYGLLRTSEGLSKIVVAEQVLGSIIMFLVIYMALFALFIWLLDRKIKHGPEGVDEELA